MQDSLEPCLTFDEFDDLVLFYIPPFLFYFEASLLIFSLNELLTKFSIIWFFTLGHDFATFNCACIRIQLLRP